MTRKKISYIFRVPRFHIYVYLQQEIENINEMYMLMKHLEDPDLINANSTCNNEKHAPGLFK